MRRRGVDRIAPVFRRSAVTAVVLLLAGPIQAAGAGDVPRIVMDAPGMVLLSGSADATLVAARFPVASAEAGALLDPRSVVDWRRPADAVRDADGELVAVPRGVSAVVALPARRAPMVRVVDVRWHREPLTPFDPADLVELGPVMILRGVPVVTVNVRAEDAGGGLPAEVRVSLSHAPDADGRDALAAAATKDVDRTAAFGHDTLINPDLYVDLHDGAADRRRAAIAAKDAVDAPHRELDNWLRLEVDATGVYRLSGFHMVTADVDLATVDPASMRLFRAHRGDLDLLPETSSSWEEDWDSLAEVALDLDGVGTTWSTADDLRFYAVGPDHWDDRVQFWSNRLAWTEHTYDDVAVYWLTWLDFGEADPFGTAPLRVGEQAAAPHGLTPATTHVKRVHLEEQVVEAYGRVEDNWAWTTNLRTEKRVDFDDPTIVPGLPAFVQVELRTLLNSSGDRYDTNVFSAHLNGGQSGSIAGSWNAFAEDDSLRSRIAGWLDDIQTGANQIIIEREYVEDYPVLILDSLDLLYTARLELGEGQAAFSRWGDEIGAPDTPVDLRLAHGLGRHIWNVSDALQPQRVSGSTDAAGTTFGITQTPLVPAHFHAFDPDELLVPEGRELRRPWDLRDLDRDIDYLVIHAPEFATAAQRLGDHRRNVLPGVAEPAVAVVDARRIYEAFGGGVRDPMALRNFLKWIWNGSGRLAYVCFVGDSSRDYRNYRNIFADQLPTRIATFFPRPFYDYTNIPHATDDVLLGLDDPPFAWNFDVPDLAGGRLCVRTAEEADRRVDQIIAYDTTPAPGDWRNKVVMAADDLTQPSDLDGWETSHQLQADYLIDAHLPESIDAEKLYLLDYEKPAGSPYKPAARQRARALWNEGLTMFHYIGHGADNTLADEQLWLTDDIYGLTNGDRRGVFLAFSCDVGIYDQITKQSMAETWVAQTDGAAIAAIAAAQVSYVTPNNQLSNAFYEVLFPGRAVVSDVSLGHALWAAKVDVGGNNSWTVENALRYLLHGDPATRLPQPMTLPELHASSSDSLRGGSREQAVLVLSDHGLSHGPGSTYSLAVLESRQPRVEHRWRDIDGDGEDEIIDSLHWWLPGAATFRGTGDVDADTLRVPFKVPLQLRYGDHGRMRLIVEGPEGSVATAVELPVAQASTGTVDDVDGPAIQLSFEHGRFRVKPGTLLEAALADTSGVSILGTNPLNSVLLEFDGDGRLLNVSDSFAFDPGSYTSGRLTFPLPGDLETGVHEVAMFASDVLGNVGSDTLAFEMVVGNAATIDDVTVFPNPTPGATSIVLELGEPMTVTWDLYTLAGHRVASLYEHFHEPGPQVMAWDGRDHVGDELANGVYLYVLRGRWAGDAEHPIVVTGQLVVMK